MVSVIHGSCFGTKSFKMLLLPPFLLNIIGGPQQETTGLNEWIFVLNRFLFPNQMEKEDLLGFSSFCMSPVQKIQITPPECGLDKKLSNTLGIARSA